MKNQSQFQSANKKQTPQEKKRLSYLKDRRNVYGERGANSRYAIRDSKDIIERQRRHAQNQPLKSLVDANDGEHIVSVENAMLSSPLNRKKFHKCPDAPLGQVISRKLAYREFKGMGRKKNTNSK